MGSIYFNGSELTGQHDVNFNGVSMDNVYFNGSKIWTRHPYAPGTDIFTYSVGAGGNTDSFIGSDGYGTYPLAFASEPTYIEGSGGALDKRVQFTLAAGFYVSRYQQDQAGTDADGVGSSNTAGVYIIYVGGTVSGLTRSSGGGSLSIGGSGNGGHNFDVTYSGE